MRFLSFEEWAGPVGFGPRNRCRIPTREGTLDDAKDAREMRLDLPLTMVAGASSPLSMEKGFGYARALYGHLLEASQPSPLEYDQGATDQAL